MRSLQVENWLSMVIYFCVFMKPPPLAVSNMPCNRSHWQS